MNSTISISTQDVVSVLVCNGLHGARSHKPGISCFVTAVVSFGDVSKFPSRTTEPSMLLLLHHSHFSKAPWILSWLTAQMVFSDSFPLLRICYHAPHIQRRESVYSMTSVCCDYLCLSAANETAVCFLKTNHLVRMCDFQRCKTFRLKLAKNWLGPSRKLKLEKDPICMPLQYFPQDNTLCNELALWMSEITLAKRWSHAVFRLMTALARHFTDSRM